MDMCPYLYVSFEYPLFLVEINSLRLECLGGPRKQICNAVGSPFQFSFLSRRPGRSS